MFPPQDWPPLARMIAARRRPGERGIGDTIEANLKGWGVHGPLQWAWRVLRGKQCACGRRRDKLNAYYPYPSNDRLKRPADDAGGPPRP